MNAFNCSPYEVAIKDIGASDGCYVFDHSGKPYLDLESGVWCTSLGHNNAVINQAMNEQMKIISHTGYRYSCDIVEQAAGRVLDALGLPGGKCLFLSSGSEAVEFAVQAAQRLCGKEKPYLLHLNNYFLSSYGQSASRPTTEWISLDVPLADTDDWERQVEQLPYDKIGAFVFEPGNASGLVHLPPVRFISQIVTKVRENGGLIVVDEVTTGVGRTGAWFGFTHYQISPDLVACGKGIGNGYPVSCVAMREGLGEELCQTGFHYAQSHQNDPLGCAVICAVLQQIIERKLIEQAAATGAYFLAQLQNLAQRTGSIKEIRGRGLMIAIQLTADLGMEKIYQRLSEEGYLVGLNIPNQVLRIYLPLIIEQQQIDAFINCLAFVLG